MSQNGGNQRGVSQSGGVPHVVEVERTIIAMTMIVVRHHHVTTGIMTVEGHLHLHITHEHETMIMIGIMIGSMRIGGHVAAHHVAEEGTWWITVDMEIPVGGVRPPTMGRGRLMWISGNGGSMGRPRHTAENVAWTEWWTRTAEEEDRHVAWTGNLTTATMCMVAPPPAIKNITHQSNKEALPSSVDTWT